MVDAALQYQVDNHLLTCRRPRGATIPSGYLKAYC